MDGRALRSLKPLRSTALFKPITPLIQFKRFPSHSKLTLLYTKRSSLQCKLQTGLVLTKQFKPSQNHRQYPIHPLQTLRPRLLKKFRPEKVEASTGIDSLTPTRLPRLAN